MIGDDKRKGFKFFCCFNIMLDVDEWREIVRRLEDPTNVFGRLTARLQQSVEGEVVSVVVHDPRGRINCYGQHIEGDALFAELNMTIGVEGSNLTGRVRYPALRRLTYPRRGCFVEGSRFGVEGYVALVNIDINPEEEVVRFS